MNHQVVYDERGLKNKKEVIKMLEIGMVMMVLTLLVLVGDMRSSDKATYLDTARAVVAGAYGKDNVWLDISLNSDGTFTRHYNKYVEFTPAECLAFLKAAAKIVSSGDYTVWGEQVASTKIGLHLLIQKTPTAKQLKTWATKVEGKAQNGNLHRYLKAMKTCFIGKNAKKPKVQESSAAAPAAGTFNIKRFNQLIEDGVSPDVAAQAAMQG